MTHRPPPPSRRLPVAPKRVQEERRVGREGASSAFAWLALLLALLAVPAVAQTAETVVVGRVTDAETGQPVAGATVRPTGGTRGAAAGADGRYLLALPRAGARTLAFSAVGYRTAERAVAARRDTVWLDVALAAATVEAGAVVVTATRTAKALEDVAVPTTVVDAEAIRQQGAARLGDVLETVPGLFLSDDHGSGLQVQGFSSDYTLVLLDGEPIVGRTAGTLDLDRLTVAGVDRVEIVEGPSSSLYGSEALAGVVNLVTALPQPGVETGGVRFGAGTFGETDATAEGGVGRDRWAARAFVNRYASGGYDLVPEEFGPTVPSFADWTADLRARADLGPSRLSLGARVAALNQTGAANLLEGGVDVPHDDSGRRVDWSVHPEWAVPLSERVRLRATLYGARYTTETQYRRQSDGVLTSSDDFDQRYAKAEAQLDALWSARHLTVVGAGAIDERLAGDRYAAEAGGEAPNAQQVYAFAQHEWEPSRLVSVNASARVDAHTDYAARLTPKLSVLVRPADALRLRASVGSGFKAPAFRQLYLAFTNAAAGGYSVFGSTRLARGLAELEAQGQIEELFFDPSSLRDIRAESSVAVNVGASADPFGWLTVDVGGFWNHVSDLIETQPVALKTSGQSVFGYFNLNRVYTRGLDVQATARLLPGLDVAASYQFLQARDRDVVDALATGTVFGRDPDGREYPLSVGDYGGLFGRSPHAATLRATFVRGDASASLRGRWRSRYGYRDLDGNGLANRDDEFVAGYAVVDLTLTHSWALRSGRLTAQAGVDNLFDTTRATLVPSMPGRTVFASLGLSF